MEKIIGDKPVKNFMNRRYLRRYKNSPIVFVHIPKAAGTSIANEIYGKRNGHLKASLVKHKLGQGFDDKYSFSVTRNPYNRLESAYRFAVDGKTKDGAIANASFYKKEVFKTYESFIKNWLAHQDLENLDPVFQPQYTFVYDKNENLLVNDLFKLEELGGVEQKLTEKMGKQVVIKKKNVTKNRQRFVYSDELKDLVYRLYEKDFKLLRYEKKGHSILSKKFQ